MKRSLESSCQCHLNRLADRGDPACQRKYHVIPGQRHPGVPINRERVRGPARPCRRQGDAPLVRVDRVRRAGHADHAEGGAGPASGDGEGAAHFDRRGRDAADGGARGEGAAARVEVRRVEDLHVEVVRGAGAAESTAAVGHGAVVEEEGGGVVVTRDSRRGELGKGVAGWVEEFRDVLGRGVREWNGRNLTTHGQDGAVRQDDRVGKGACIGLRADGLDCRCSGGRAYRDDMGVGGSVGVLVVW